MDDMHFSFKIENPPAWLPIGRTAENDWRTIEIDCSYWFNMDATGNVVLMYRPSCGMSPYPLLTERDGDNIVWHPKSGELVEGVGQMQAFFYVGESKIGSSKMVSCEVDGSLLGGDPGTDPGAVAPPWAIDIIEQIAVLSGHYPKIIDGNLYIWDSALNEWVEFEASGGVSSDAVLYTPQTLNDSQKAQARSNIDATKLFVVRIASESDTLTANKTFAETYAATQNGMLVRADLWNMDGDLWLDCIDAEPTQIVFGGGAFGAQMTLVFGSDESLTRTTRQIPTDTVLYTEQSLTPEQQEQARKNIGAGTYSKPSGGIPKTDLASDVQTSLGKADTALQTAPVTSVNNKTGAVTLTASDVGALPSSTSIPTKVSDLTNDSGYQTAQDVQTAISGVRQLPTGGSVGDFLRKDTNGNAAWETLSTWQGGSY